METESSSRYSLLKMYRREIDKYPLLTAEEEQYYAKLVQASLIGIDGDRAPKSKARTKLAECNLRLVFDIAKKLGAKHNVGMKHPHFLDLVDEGNIGLLRAIDKFDPEKEYRFSTYATWWIKHFIDRWFSNHHRTIRLPVHVYNGIGSLIRAERKLWLEKDNEEPNSVELAEDLDLPEEKVANLMQYRKPLVSYDQPFGVDEEGSLSYENVISIEEEESESGLDVGDIHSSVSVFLEMLDKKKRDVLIMRFGLWGYEKHTLEEVGGEIGVTRERVRQIQEEALKELRTSHYAKQVLQFMDCATEQ